MKYSDLRKKKHVTTIRSGRRTTKSIESKRKRTSPIPERKMRMKASSMYAVASAMSVAELLRVD